jgi:hypothetical protein
MSYDIGSLLLTEDPGKKCKVLTEEVLGEIDVKVQHSPWKNPFA